MSRYTVYNPEEETALTYGFDEPLSEYFAFVSRPLTEQEENDPDYEDQNYIVVTGDELLGISRAGFAQLIEDHNFIELIPKQHLESIFLDLPF